MGQDNHVWNARDPRDLQEVALLVQALYSAAVVYSSLFAGHGGTTLVEQSYCYMVELWGLHMNLMPSFWWAARASLYRPTRRLDECAGYCGGQLGVGSIFLNLTTDPSGVLKPATSSSRVLRLCLETTTSPTRDPLRWARHVAGPVQDGRNLGAQTRCIWVWPVSISFIDGAMAASM